MKPQQQQERQRELICLFRRRERTPRCAALHDPQLQGNVYSSLLVLCQEGKVGTPVNGKVNEKSSLPLSAFPPFSFACCLLLCSPCLCYFTFYKKNLSQIPKYLKLFLIDAEYGFCPFPTPSPLRNQISAKKIIVGKSITFSL